jgi:hypothetical protein
MFSGRGDRLAGKPSLEDAEVELLNKIQQLGANAGAYKRLAIPARRFHEP